ncbi:hypothetical protein H2198_003123 [Neophaeococcomyces mojaviensis]|uniref:Uncharacterized protein n=1 Tax=Neophaeococcomyces mojaviensis TaxID=3383035 RepID=A0ACC3ACS2_9EURO|nr:hypothetical protein H2198_003123 [Knufia sp. JES_112]
MSLSGSTYITEHTALSDQHLVRGRCDIQYWLTAEFISDITGATPKPNSFNRVLDLPFQPTFIALDSSTSIAKTPARFRLKESCSTISSTLGLTKTICQWPQIIFEIPKVIPQNLNCHQIARRKLYKFTMPLATTITIPSPRTAAQATSSTVLRHLLIQRGLRDIISIRPHFRKQITFGVGKRTPGHSVTKDNTEDIQVDPACVNMYFPPFYAEQTKDGDAYTAVIELELSIPESCLPSCSYESELLKVRYTLELDVTAQKVQNSGMVLMPECTARLESKCFVS